ncbi:MAG: hypothetical protein A3E83_02690 [Gammaproteobacteria bacterium RIFCSPHIGHO2_12_FULL_41_20]|nr:MAG: hypothetical protein A3E83_02690 [Gammaproteobacteria bacterium RIFCSPHIGHO2_12_FULL_41_20]
MKVLFLTPWFPSHRQDQAGNYILDSLEALSNLGHKLTVLVTQPWRPRVAKFLSKDWDKAPIDIEQFSNNLNLHIRHHLSIPRNYFRPISNFAYKKQITPTLEMLIHKYPCQLIHAHTELAGWLAVNIAKRLGIPSVVTLHGIDTDHKLYSGITKKQLFEYTLTNADRIVLVGNPLMSFFKNFTKTHDHFRVVYNGFRFGQQIDNNKLCQESLRLISVSNLHEGKGIDLNLHALSKLKTSGITRWTYRIIGDGYQRKQLEALVDSLNLRDHVSFFGACLHNDVYKHLAESDVFILPSYREAFGIAYVEAMSLGLLTIGVKGQGPEAFIKHEKTGLLVPPHDIETLASTLKLIMQSRDKMREIATAGKNHVLQRFTWQRHAENLTKIYEELLPHNADII